MLHRLRQILTFFQQFTIIEYFADGRGIVDLHRFHIIFHIRIDSDQTLQAALQQMFIVILVVTNAD